MSAVDFLKKQKILAELSEVFKSEKERIKCPISLNEYEVSPIKAYEVQRLKKVKTVKSLIKGIIELALSKVENESVEAVIENNSYLDYYEILKAVLDTSFEEYERADFECPECGNKFDLKLKYSDFKNISNLWDKKESFKNYEIVYEYRDENKGIVIKFVMGIPTIRDFYSLVTKLSEEITPRATTNSPVSLSAGILSDIETLVLITKKLEIKVPSLEEPFITSDKLQIKELIEDANIPLKILKRAFEKYSNEIKDYVPIYKTEATCPHCKEKIDLYLEPQIAFIDRLFS